MTYKTKIVDDKEVKFRSDWIFNLESKEHFQWYYNQAYLVYSECSRSNYILEINPGTNLLADLLRRRQWNVKTLDIDPGKAADFHGDALTFSYSDSTGRSFDTILEFQIFEHILIETFNRVFQKLASLNALERILFSLPLCENRVFGISVTIPKFKRLEYQLWIPKNKINCRSHFWETTNGSFTKYPPDKVLLTQNDIFELFGDNNFKLHHRASYEYIRYYTTTKKSHGEPVT